MNVSNAIMLFLEHCEFEKNLSDNTLQFYKIDLLQFQEFLNTKGVDKIKFIGKFNIKAYVQNLSRFEPRTIKRKIASSKTFLNFLEFEDYIIINPYRKIKLRIKEPRNLPTVLDFEEIKHLLQIIRVEKEKVSDPSSHQYGEKLRDLCVIELLFATGIRVSELCGLKGSNINLTNGNVLVTGKGSKERIIQICNEESLNILREYQEIYQSRIESTGFFLSVD